MTTRNTAMAATRGRISMGRLLALALTRVFSMNHRQRRTMPKNLGPTWPALLCRLRQRLRVLLSGADYWAVFGSAVRQRRARFLKPQCNRGVARHAQIAPGR